MPMPVPEGAHVALAVVKLVVGLELRRPPDSQKRSAPAAAKGNQDPGAGEGLPGLLPSLSPQGK